jgi:hypothetical protein
MVNTSQSPPESHTIISRIRSTIHTKTTTMNQTRILPAVTIICLLSCLHACVVPPSRGYDERQSNIRVLQEEALNIDRIKPETRKVEAIKPWQNTGVFLENGQVVSIVASGKWSPWPEIGAWSGPEGNITWNVEVPGIPGGALMAKLGYDGKPFKIGAVQTFRAQDYGMLYLAINDPFNYLFNNQGEVEANIYVDGGAQSGAAGNANNAGKIKVVSYSYNDKTREGSLSARAESDQFKLRSWMLNKIGEIASSKNVAIKAGEEPLNGGSYEVLDESMTDGVMTINFRAAW